MDRGTSGSAPPPPTPPRKGEGSTGCDRTAPSPLAGEGRGGGWRRRLTLYGPLSGLGLAVAFLTFVLDQGHKWWMLGPYDIAAHAPVRVTPFLDLVLTWNRGISYGWLAQDSDAGRWALVVVSLAIIAGLFVWLARLRWPPGAAALGLVIGGALGNALDRIIHGAVPDFFLFHAFGFSWYVFNLADVAIVAGIGLLFYESLTEGRRRQAGG